MPLKWLDSKYIPSFLSLLFVLKILLLKAMFEEDHSLSEIKTLECSTDFRSANLVFIRCLDKLYKHIENDTR